MHVSFELQRVTVRVNISHSIGLAARKFVLGISSFSHWYPGSVVVLDCIDS